MHSVTIIAVGKMQADYYKKAASEYEKRLSAYCNIKVVEIAEFTINEKNASEKLTQKALENEAKNIIDKLPKNALVVSLCIEGKTYTSEEFAQFFNKSAVEGSSHIVFIIGSSHGLANEIKNISKKMSFGKMTFAHQLARVMLLEQIYRAFSILNGTKYHK